LPTKLIKRRKRGKGGRPHRTYHYRNRQRR
jgi:hypothetical protein